MVAYKVDPIAVQAVLAKVQPHLEDLQSAATGVATSMNEAATASGSKIVAAALSDFAQARAPLVVCADELARGAVAGTAAAVLAYVEGDLAMMRAAQAHAVPVEASRPGPSRVGYL